MTSREAPARLGAPASLIAAGFLVDDGGRPRLRGGSEAATWAVSPHRCRRDPSSVDLVEFAVRNNPRWYSSSLMRCWSSAVRFLSMVPLLVEMATASSGRLATRLVTLLTCSLSRVGNSCGLCRDDHSSRTHLAVERGTLAKLAGFGAVGGAPCFYPVEAANSRRKVLACHLDSEFWCFVVGCDRRCVRSREAGASGTTEVSLPRGDLFPDMRSLKHHLPGDWFLFLRASADGLRRRRKGRSMGPSGLGSACGGKSHL